MWSQKVFALGAKPKRGLGSETAPLPIAVHVDAQVANVELGHGESEEPDKIKEYRLAPERLIGNLNLTWQNRESSAFAILDDRELLFDILVNCSDSAIEGLHGDSEKSEKTEKTNYVCNK